MGPDVRYGLLHGRLSSEEKAAALDAFARGDTNVLIATTVVEVKPPFSACPSFSWKACVTRAMGQHHRFLTWSLRAHVQTDLRRARTAMQTPL